MTEGKDKFVVVLNEQGKAVSRRAHVFNDCTTLRDDNGKVGTIGTSEMALLGLKVCTVCERMQTGGPAIEALTEILQDSVNELLATNADDFQADQAAWHTVEELKSRGFYIAQRKPKTDSD